MHAATIAIAPLFAARQGQRITGVQTVAGQESYIAPEATASRAPVAAQGA